VDYTINFQIYCTFSSLIEFSKVRLFKATGTYSNFDQNKVIYKSIRPQREEKLYLMKRSRTNLNAGEYM
jgi:hypothetical protein